MNRHSILLVAEDSDEDFETFREAANDCGVADQVRRVTSGDECLLALRAPFTEPVIVLMDLGLPGTDGRATLTAIRNDPRRHTVPVVILTTSANPRDLDHCYRHGANAYHVKPLDYLAHRELLRDVIGYWMRRVTLPRLERLT